MGRSEGSKEGSDATKVEAREKRRRELVDHAFEAPLLDVHIDGTAGVLVKRVLAAQAPTEDAEGATALGFDAFVRVPQGAHSVRMCVVGAVAACSPFREISVRESDANTAVSAVMAAVDAVADAGADANAEAAADASEGLVDGPVVYVFYPHPEHSSGGPEALHQVRVFHCPDAARARVPCCLCLHALTR